MLHLIKISILLLFSLSSLLLPFSCATCNTLSPNNTYSPRVGDSAFYELIGGIAQKRSILNINHHNVQILAQTFLDQNLLRSETIDIPHQQFFLASSFSKNNNPQNYQEQTITINDKTFNCFILLSSEQNFLIKKWLSPQAPLDGLVQMARDDNVILRLNPSGNNAL